MNIAKITHISPPGKVWTANTPGGPAQMYPFSISFDDGQTGEVNAKTNPPAYRVGDMVGYEISGQTPRGASKLKITRNPQPGAGVVTSPPPMDTSNPDLEAATPQPAIRAPHYRPQPQTPPSVPQNAPVVHPATVGMCMKMAGDFLIREDGWGQDTASRLEAIAQELIQVAQRLEKGTTDPF